MSACRTVAVAASRSKPSASSRPLASATDVTTCAQIPARLFDYIQLHVSDRLVFLILLNVFLLAVGCMIDMFSALILVVPLILPIAEGYKVDPVHLGIIFLTNLEIGYSTPPVGLNLFIASARFERPILSMSATERDGRAVGLTTLFGLAFETTGVLGLSADFRGLPAARGFPRWLTLPSYADLATGRRWHFFFAWLFVLNGAMYVAHAVASGRIRRDLLPSASQLRGIG